MSLRSKLKIYLAGTSNRNALKYRSDAKNYFGKKLILFDPFVEIEENITNTSGLNKPWQLSDEEVDRIVIEDKEAIKTCDILVAYIENFTCGTVMEILHAWNNQIPIFVINPEKNRIHDVWLRYHTKQFFTNTHECFKYIIDEVSK